MFWPLRSSLSKEHPTIPLMPVEHDRLMFAARPRTSKESNGWCNGGSNMPASRRRKREEEKRSPQNIVPRGAGRTRLSSNRSLRPVRVPRREKKKPGGTGHGSPAPKSVKKYPETGLPGSQARREALFRAGKLRALGASNHWFFEDHENCGGWRILLGTTWKPWETIVGWYLQGNLQSGVS